MKKEGILQRLALIVVLAVIVASCGKKTQDYWETIPADANFVVTVEVGELLKKGDFSTLVRSDKVQSLLSQFKDSINTNTSALINACLENPAETGLDLSVPVALFDNVSPENTGFLAKVADEKKLAKLFETMQGEGTCEVMTDGWVKFEEGALCKYNDQKLLLFVMKVKETDAVKTEIEKMFNLSGKSLTEQKTFSDFLNIKKDINCWLNMSVMSSAADMEMYKMMLPPGVDFSSMVVLYGLSFEKGLVSFDMKYVAEDPETIKQMEKWNVYTGEQKGVFLKNVPETAWLSFGCNIKGKSMSELLMTIPVVTQYSARMKEEMQLDLQKCVASIDGDLFYSITGKSDNIGLLSMVPSIAIFTQVSDDYLLTVTKSIIEGNGLGVTSTGGNSYKAEIFGMSILFGIEDGKYYITNSKTIADSIQKGLQPSLADNKNAGIFKTGLSGGYININAFMSEYGNTIIPTVFRDNGDKLISIYSQFESVKIYGKDSNMGGTIEIVMNDKEKNSLNTILSIIESYN